MHWYVRNHDKITGPFPAGQIQQAILLGRISIQTEVSQDKAQWVSVQECPELIPDVLKRDTGDEHARERLAAARRWADERRGERRNGDTDPTRTGPGRRNRESVATLNYRDHRENLLRTLRPGREHFIVVMLSVFALITAGIYAGFKWIPQQPAGPRCEASAQRGVNWQQCDKAGEQLLNTDLSDAILNSINLKNSNLFGSQFIKADMSYANLSHSDLSFADFQGARLKGANLRAADLSKANLNSADLSYADLSDAKIGDAVFTNADFSNAIWVDGRKCLAGSKGLCRFAR